MDSLSRSKDSKAVAMEDGKRNYLKRNEVACELSSRSANNVSDQHHGGGDNNVGCFHGKQNKVIAGLHQYWVHPQL